MTFSRVAVLNRGDAAMRFLRTARELAAGGPQLQVVAVYTDPDAGAPFVRLADDAVHLGPAVQEATDGSLRPAYCLHDLVLERLVAAEVDAVWPGWGFVAEDPDFVDRIEAAGIAFIGPPADAMRALGDKVRAKELAARCDVPLAPWAELPIDGHPEEWLAVAGEVGYPLMVKAANGGGGRGIRRVDTASQLVAAVRAVMVEARAAFGPGAVLVERAIDSARHLEVQFLVGADGRAETLGVRDCTIQRRHQKLLEETPAPALPDEVADRLTAATRRLAEGAGYRGVGTAEYLYLPSEQLATFCEVNARLQVEHTVTEMVWGVDLVRAQIDIALGCQHERSEGPRGWAVQARLVAEDTERGFAAAPGRVVVHRPPAGPNVRVDAGIEEGSEIAPEFDSMVAKVLGWGQTREQALATLARALGEYEVLVADGATNRGLLLDLLTREEVTRATATTTWLEQVEGLGIGGTHDEVVALALAAIELARTDRAHRVGDFLRGARSGVPQPDPAATRPFEVELTLRGEGHHLVVLHRGGPRWEVGPPGRGLRLDVEQLDEHTVSVRIGGCRTRALVHRGLGGVTVDLAGRLHRVQERATGTVTAPGPALLVALDVEIGDRVEAGQRLGTLEAMKTETPLLAETAGEVHRVLVDVGSRVLAGEALLVIRPLDAEAETASDTPGAAAWPVPPTGRGKSPARVAETIDALLYGFDVDPGEIDEAVDALEQVANAPGLLTEPNASEWTALGERLDAMASVGSIFDRRRPLVDDDARVVTAEGAFHELCRALSDERATTVPELEPLLEPVFAAHGAGDDQPDDEHRRAARAEVLWRMKGVRARRHDRQRLLGALVRAVVPLAQRGQLPLEEIVRSLGAVEHVLASDLPRVALAAAAARSELQPSSRDTSPAGREGPWEVISLLEGRAAGPAPHPSLEVGRFVEYDLGVEHGLSEVSGGDQHVLIPVERPPGGHRCALLVGTIANPLPGRRDWAERVLVVSDRSRSMGSLGEPECRRVIAALDLAEARGVPVEWVAVSSGARIALDSGTENLDWTAAVLRRIVEFTTAGGEIDVIVAGPNVGAQSYWNAEATMLMHTKGILVMTPDASMVLTGKQALELSGGVAAEDEVGIGGHDRVMGPNGQSQYRAEDLRGAYALMMEHRSLTWCGRPDERFGSRRAARLATADPADRDVCVEPYKGGQGEFTTIGEIFDKRTNPGRKRPFSVRALMGAVVDRDAPRMERWRTMAGAEGAVVWETRLGGHPVSLIGIESEPRPRVDHPVDGPPEWAAGTLYPASSKKVARAIRAASGNRAAVVLANLSGFDGSPESLRMLQLEYGAEIARAVVEFEGPIVFVVVGRYHGGAYVVFSKRLNDRLTAIAVEGSYASVIGGAAAAAVVLRAEVRERASRDARVCELRDRLEGEQDPSARDLLARELAAAEQAAQVGARTAVAEEFDAVHTVERALRVGSLDAVVPAAELRPSIIEVLDASADGDHRPNDRTWSGPTRRPGPLVQLRSG